MVMVEIVPNPQFRSRDLNVMTVDELLARESIRHTLASYNMAGDRVKGDEVAACFTEDGVLESDGSLGAAGFHYAGRPAIRAFFTTFREAPEGMAPPSGQRRFVRHNLTTCQIELTGTDTAKARTYFAVVFTHIGPDHCGYYVDAFRKVGERWLIAHRKVRVDWKSPNSVAGAPPPAG